MIIVLATSASTSIFVEEHPNFIGSIMPPFFHQQRQLSWLPLNRDTSEGALASHTKVQNNTVHTMKWPPSKVTWIKNDRTHSLPKKPWTTGNTGVIFAYFATTDTTSIIYNDQTGKFPIQSSWGYKYVVICYAYSCNAVLAHPIKNISANELLQAYQHFYTILHNASPSPQMHKMDNETSADHVHFIATQNSALQYVPLDNHCTNAVEQVIQSWKNHFISGFAGLSKDFPITHWCQLIDQANIMLNLVQPN